MLQLSLLYYKKIKKSREDMIQNQLLQSFVENRMINRTSHAVIWNFDDLKSSHVDPKVNNKFHAWLES